MQVEDNAEYGATGMLDSISRCVRKGYPRLQRTLNGYFSNTFVGITLFVSTQGCGRPQEADEQEGGYPRFCCVVSLKQYY